MKVGIISALVMIDGFCYGTDGYAYVFVGVDKDETVIGKNMLEFI